MFYFLFIVDVFVVFASIKGRINVRHLPTKVSDKHVYTQKNTFYIFLTNNFCEYKSDGTVEIEENYVALCPTC